MRATDYVSKVNEKGQAPSPPHQLSCAHQGQHIRFVQGISYPRKECTPRNQTPNGGVTYSRIAQKQQAWLSVI